MDERVLKDKLFKAATIAVALAALAPLFAIAGSVAAEGLPVLARAGLKFFTGLPPSPLSKEPGGIAPSIIGTVILTVLSTAIAFPLAFFTAVLATEFPGSRIARITGVLVRSFTEVPTIIVGVLVYSLMVIPMGHYSLLAGAVALAIVALPYVYVHVERALASIPPTYREAAYALGMDRFKALVRVFIGIARRGVLAGLLMGIAKASGETAPLLFTIGGARHSLYQGVTQPGDAIPLLIFDYAQTPYKIYHDVAWGAALVLLAGYLAVYTALRTIVKEVKM